MIVTAYGGEMISEPEVCSYTEFHVAANNLTGARQISDSHDQDSGVATKVFLTEDSPPRALVWIGTWEPMADTGAIEDWNGPDI